MSNRLRTVILAPSAGYAYQIANRRLFVLLNGIVTLISLAIEAPRYRSFPKKPAPKSNATLSASGPEEKNVTESTGPGTHFATGCFNPKRPRSEWPWDFQAIPEHIKTQLAKGNIMTIIKSLSTLSLALAMMGGVVVLTPSSAKAGQFISNPALGHNVITCSVRGGTTNNCRPGKQANPPTRGCSKIAMCRG
jgi:hypothetical protein